MLFPYFSTISIKVDCVSRLERSIIGINAQYIENGCIKIKTLAMKEIFVKHSGLNLSNIIMNVLKSFEINMDQIYTLTVDNAANMINVGKYLNMNAQVFQPSQQSHSESKEIQNEVVHMETEGNKNVYIKKLLIKLSKSLTL